MSRYTNPWTTSPDFVDLGPYDIGYLDKPTDRYDLYALIQDAHCISFGARYGNEDHEYLSGEAFKLPNGTWELYVSRELAIAAARYFANYYKE